MTSDRFSDGPMGNHPASGNDDRPALSVKETSVYLHIGVRQTYEAIHRGEIPSIKIGGRILVPRKRLVAMLEGTA